MDGKKKKKKSKHHHHHHHHHRHHGNNKKPSEEPEPPEAEPEPDEPETSIPKDTLLWAEMIKGFPFAQGTSQQDINQPGVRMMLKMAEAANKLVEDLEKATLGSDEKSSDAEASNADDTEPRQREYFSSEPGTSSQPAPTEYCEYLKRHAKPVKRITAEYRKFFEAELDALYSFDNHPDIFNSAELGFKTWSDVPDNYHHDNCRSEISRYNPHLACILQQNSPKPKPPCPAYPLHDLSECQFRTVPSMLRSPTLVELIDRNFYHLPENADPVLLVLEQMEANNQLTTCCHTSTTEPTSDTASAPTSDTASAPTSDTASAPTSDTASAPTSDTASASASATGSASGTSSSATASGSNTSLRRYPYSHPKPDSSKKPSRW